MQRRGQLLRGVDPEGTRSDKCMGGGKHTRANRREREKSFSSRYTPTEKWGWGVGVMVALEFSHFQVSWNGHQVAGGSTLCVCPRKGKKHTLAQTTAGAPFTVLLFQVGSKRRDNITLPFTHKRESRDTQIISLSFPVNKLPFVHAACLLAWIGVGILALPPKGYCQFIKSLFILRGSAGRQGGSGYEEKGELCPLCSP